MEKLFDEITLSYSLVFGQTLDGLTTLSTISSRRTRVADRSDLEFDPVITPIASAGCPACEIHVFPWNDRALKSCGASTIPPTIDDFFIFAGRLERLQQQMRDWRPRRIRHIFRPGYGDRFIWYTQMFAFVIAIITTLSLICSLIQALYAIRTYNDSMNVALQSLEVAVKSLNVSLESLALQQLSLNMTS